MLPVEQARDDLGDNQRVQVHLIDFGTARPCLLPDAPQPDQQPLGGQARHCKTPLNEDPVDFEVTLHGTPSYLPPWVLTRRHMNDAWATDMWATCQMYVEKQRLSV